MGSANDSAVASLNALPVLAERNGRPCPRYRAKTCQGRSRTTPALPSWRLKLAIAYIDDHLSDRVLLAEMAAAAGLTSMHFAASFRTATGKSPHHYLLHRRIEVAKDYLVDGKMPLIDVAFSVGFQSQSHFSSVFKRATGRTPREWRCTAGDAPVDRR